MSADGTPADEVIIEAHGVGKKFASYRRKATSLKERLIRREQTEADVFWALRDVDIEVRRGETVGLIGPNGSGKSTLLKVLSGILRPNEGTVRVAGRVASLLELGAGFDGELTGRENIYLNAALLGITRTETDTLFDDIVDFSELHQFIDTPVKHYSSGMYVRLGFAVAVHVDPDVLIIDEVLAVGDAAFQKKCLDRIEEFQAQGKTILFVSHSADLVEQLCTRATLLSHGRVIYDGRPGEATNQLSSILGIDTLPSEADALATVSSMVILDPVDGEPLEEFRCGTAALVRAEVLWNEPLRLGAKLSLHFNSPAEHSPIMEVEPLWFKVSPQQVAIGVSHLEWTIQALPDVPGDFSISLGVYTNEELIAHGRIGGIRLSGATPRVVPGALTFSDTDRLTGPPSASSTD